MDLEEIDISAGIWVDPAQDRDYWGVLVNAALNLRIPYAMELVKPTGNGPLRRSRRRWEDNIITDLKEIGIGTRN